MAKPNFNIFTQTYLNIIFCKVNLCSMIKNIYLTSILSITKLITFNSKTLVTLSFSTAILTILREYYTY